MKNLLIILLFFSTLVVKAQKTSVEKSTFGVQTGVLGIWAYNEAKLSNNLALRTELGFDFGIWETTFYDDYDSPFILTPVIVIEPRFYYNLKKRSKNSKQNKKLRKLIVENIVLSVQPNTTQELLILQHADKDM